MQFVAAAVAGAVRPDRGRVTTSIRGRDSSVVVIVVSSCDHASNRRSLQGTAPQGAHVGRPAPDVRQAARDAVQHPRAAHRRARACSTGTPARAPSGSRRSAAARRTSRSSRRTAAPAALIEANLAACGVEGGYTIERGDRCRAAARCRRADAFDLILLDPPYDIDTRQRRARRGGAARWPADGLVVLERATRREPDVPAALRARSAT